MEDFNPMRKKMLEYRSPLPLEEAWESLELRKENRALQKRVRVKNISLISSLGISCILLLLWIRNLSPVQEVVEIKDQTTLSEERTVGGENDSEVVEEKHPLTSTQTEKQKKKLLRAMEVVEDSYLPLPSGGNELFYHSVEDALVHSDNHLQIFPLKGLTPSQLLNSILSAKILKVPSNSMMVDRKGTSHEKGPLEEEKPLLEEESEVGSKSIVGTKLQSEPDSGVSTSLIDMPPGGTSARTGKIGGRKNFVKLELLGQGLLYSVNYGRIIRRREYGDLDFQIGISLHPRAIDSEGREVLTQVIPISVNQSFRIRPNHNLLFGVGASYVNDQVGNAANINSVFTALKAGYRYQKPGKRLFFEGEILFLQTLTPGSETDWLDSIVTGGLSIGYRF